MASTLPMIWRAMLPSLPSTRSWTGLSRPARSSRSKPAGITSAAMACPRRNAVSAALASLPSTAASSWLPRRLRASSREAALRSPSARRSGMRSMSKLSPKPRSMSMMTGIPSAMYSVRGSRWMCSTSLAAIAPTRRRKRSGREIMPPSPPGPGPPERRLRARARRLRCSPRARPRRPGRPQGAPCPRARDRLAGAARRRTARPR